MSTLTGLLPVVLLIAFVAWVLWRRRALESSGSLDQFELEKSSTEGPAPWSTESPEASSTQSMELPPPASVVVTPVRWEPPVRSAGQAPPRSPQPAASPSGGPGQDEAPLDGPRRGRIEDLLERARLEDEGAA